MDFRNVSNTFTVAGSSVYLFKGIILNECSLNNCTILFFAEIKLFPEHFEATTFYKDASYVLYVGK